jgi:hypothetical protein
MSATSRYLSGMMRPEHPLHGTPCTAEAECWTCGQFDTCGQPATFKAFNTEAHAGFVYCTAHIEPTDSRPFTCRECR